MTTFQLSGLFDEHFYIASGFLLTVFTSLVQVRDDAQTFPWLMADIENFTGDIPQSHQKKNNPAKILSRSRHLKPAQPKNPAIITPPVFQIPPTYLSIPPPLLLWFTVHCVQVSSTRWADCRQHNGRTEHHR